MSACPCFDVLNKVTENIPIAVTSGIYTNVIAKDNYLYLMPQKLDNGILKYNLKDKSQKNLYVSSKYECITQYECSFIVDDIIYGLPWEGNTMYMFDCRNDKIEIKEINDNSRNIYSYYYAHKINEERYLIISNNKNAPCLIWDKDEIKLIDIKLPEDYFIKELLMEIEERR